MVIVDDDELIRKGLERVIHWEKLGFTVKGAFPNAMEALAYLKTHTVDVLLTDIRMPEMSGLELITEVKKRQPGIRSVIISGHGEFALAKEALLLKVEDYLLKPIGEDEIERVFSKLKATLDRENDSDPDENKKICKEYRLMRSLEAHIQKMPLFAERAKTCYELLVIHIKVNTQDKTCHELSAEHLKKVRRILLNCFFDLLDDLIVAIVPPEALGEILEALERELSSSPAVRYQILMGRQVHSNEDIISAYWSAIEMLSSAPDGQVTLCSNGRSIHKEEWAVIQRAHQALISTLESGHFQAVDQKIDDILRTLDRYDNRDRYHFCCDILTKLRQYFGMDTYGAFRLPLHHSQAYIDLPDAGTIETYFKQDVEQVKKSLWENSDTMKNLIVGRSKMIIEKNYSDESLSLASVANELNISYGYLSTIFSKVEGKSFKSYLMEVRMKKTRELLLSRNYYNYEIASMVGYKNPRYFTDVFKKYYKYSPGEYIARFRRADSR